MSRPSRIDGARSAAAGPVARLATLAVAVGIALVASISLGAARLPLATVAAALLGRASAADAAIVLQLRLPRAAVAALVGGALATSGAVFQALLRNPLADPYILGVSGGAAVGAVAAFALGWGLTGLGVPTAAFLGAVAAVVIVFRIAAGAGRALDTRVLLLAGVVAGAFFNAIVMLFLTLSPASAFRSAIFWMMGSLADSTWRQALVLALYLLPASLALMLLARPLDLLALGEEPAMYLGVRVERVKLVAYGIASLVVAASVAACGAIGFVGLVVPHAIRLLWGSGHRLLLPASFLAGAAFLLLADTAARTVAGAQELPVGVVTALVGVPVFATLLRRRRA